jgi:hypothetical protein
VGSNDSTGLRRATFAALLLLLLLLLLLRWLSCATGPRSAGNVR